MCSFFYDSWLTSTQDTCTAATSRPKTASAACWETQSRTSWRSWSHSGFLGIYWEHQSMIRSQTTIKVHDCSTFRTTGNVWVLSWFEQEKFNECNNQAWMGWTINYMFLYTFRDVYCTLAAYTMLSWSKPDIWMKCTYPLPVHLTLKDKVWCGACKSGRSSDAGRVAHAQAHPFIQPQIPFFPSLPSVLSCWIIGMLLIWDVIW